jgi:hypothetical protein
MGVAAMAAGGSSAAAAAAERAAAAGFPGVRRVLLGGSVYFHSPGNPELHAPLGGGLEGWLGFKEVRPRLASALAVQEAQSRRGHCCKQMLSLPKGTLHTR